MIYDPVFSYVAMWKRDLDASINGLALLETLISDESIADCIKKMKDIQVGDI